MKNICITWGIALTLLTNINHLHSTIVSAHILQNTSDKRVILLAEIHNREDESGNPLEQFKAIEEALLAPEDSKKIGCVLELQSIDAAQIRQLNASKSIGIPKDLLNAFLSKTLSPSVTLIPGDIRTEALSNIGNVLLNIRGCIKAMNTNHAQWKTIKNMTLNECIKADAEIFSRSNQALHMLENFEKKTESASHDLISDLIEAIKKIRMFCPEMHQERIHQCLTILYTQLIEHSSLSKALRNMPAQTLCFCTSVIVQDIFEIYFQKKIVQAIQSHNLVVALCGAGHIPALVKLLTIPGPLKIVTTIGNNFHDIPCSHEEIEIIAHYIKNESSDSRH